MELIRIILLPLAMIYGIVMFIRNKLFDWEVIKSEKFKIPVISIGNLSVGGTGKTPHVEYLVRMLSEKYKVATLSRGYGRKSNGFVLADINSDYFEIGDEPLQYKQNFQDVTVAVDEKRTRGIRILSNTDPELDLIILDDAFQHRYVKPGISILLTDFHNLYPVDYPFPTGRLREFRKGASRADIIIVSKTPAIFSPITRRRLINLIHPRPKQKLYFSYIKYREIVPVPGIETRVKINQVNTIMLFCGIANSYPIQEHLKTRCEELVVMEFPDHHKYSLKDVQKIIKTYNDIFSRNKIIITTEKDTMRLIKTELIEYLKEFPVFYVPIEVAFHKDDGEKFDRQIISYVEKNKRDGRISREQYKS